MLKMISLTSPHYKQTVDTLNSIRELLKLVIQNKFKKPITATDYHY